MEYTHLLLSLAIVDFLAVASPGPNFMVVSQVATAVSRRSALFVVVGILASNLTWCAAVFLGLSAIFHASPLLHSAAQVLGAMYLIYLAILLWRAPAGSAATPERTSSVPRSSDGGAFMRGWYVGMSNPKSLVYFSSVFTVFLPHGSSLLQPSLALSIVVLNTVVWYGLVAVVLSQPQVQRRFLDWQLAVNRIAGTVLGVFGARLLLARADA